MEVGTDASGVERCLYSDPDDGSLLSAGSRPDRAGPWYSSAALDFAILGTLLVYGARAQILLRSTSALTARAAVAPPPVQRPAPWVLRAKMPSLAAAGFVAFGASLVAYGSWVGTLASAAGVVLLVAPLGEMRLDDDGLGVRSLFRRRRYAWSDLATVRPGSTWFGPRGVEIVVAVGKVETPYGFNMVVPCSDDELSDFIAVAAARATGPTPLTPDASAPLFPSLAARRGCVFWGIVICLVLLGLVAIGAGVVALA